MNICTGWSPPPRRPTSSRRTIIAHASVKVKELAQAEMMLAALISAEEKAKYISVNWI